MAVREVTIQWDADAGSLEQSRDVIKQIAQALNLTEEQVRRLSKGFEEQTGILGKLRAKEVALRRARDQSQNPEQIRRFNREIRETQREVQELTGEYQRQGGVLRSIGGLVAGACAVEGIRRMVTGAVELASSMETTRISFEQFTGSAEAAKDVLGDIEQFAASTPFQFPELADTAKNLLAFGVEQERILPILRQLGDVAAGTGNQVSELGAIYGKVVTKGKAQSEELLQLAERGVPIIQVLGEMYGKTGEEIFKMGSDGEITGEVIEAAFQKMTGEGGKFFELTQKQSETTSGRLSTLRDNFEKLARQIGENLLPVVNALASGLLTVFKLIGLDKKQVDLEELFDLGEAGTKILEFLPRLQTHFSATDEEFQKFTNTLGDFEFKADDMDGAVAELTRRFVEFRTGVDLSGKAQAGANAVTDLATKATKKASKAKKKDVDAIKEHGEAVDALTEKLKLLKLELVFTPDPAGIRKQINAAQAELDKMVPPSIRFNAESFEVDDEAAMGILDEIEGGLKAAPPIDLDDEILNINTDGIKERLSGLFEPANQDLIEFLEDLKGAMGEFQGLAAAGIGIIDDITTASFNNRISELDAMKEKELSNANLTADQKIAIEERFAAKEDEIRARKAAQEKRLATFEAIISTAAAIVKALPNIPLSLIAAATGAAQIAVIQSQSFKKGGYTGDFGTSEAAGVVHGQEFVIDAPTTKALGLRGKSMKDLKTKLAPVFMTDLVQSKLGNAARTVASDNRDVVQAISGLKKQIAGLQIHNIHLDEHGFTRYVASQQSRNYHLKKILHG